jgi:1-acyl-sn-glycerol-3-phosphate acyltransferase
MSPVNGRGPDGAWPSSNGRPAARHSVALHRKRIPVNRSTIKMARKLAPAGLATMARRLPFPLNPPTAPAGVELRPEVSTLGADYDTDWARTYPARLARLLLLQVAVRPAMAALASPTIKGLDRLSELDGAAIFAANHHSHLDTPLVLSSLPEPWRHHAFVGAAADYFFGNRVTAPLSALVIGAIPIERTKVGRKSADEAAGLINDGWSMLIFPEGGRSPDGWGQPFRGGAAYLALRCGVPVVPIHVEGTGRILRKGRSLPKPAATTITYGHPLVPLEGESSSRFGARIEAAVAALADETATDWWEARKRAHAHQSPSLQGPDDLGGWRRAWSLGDRRGRPTSRRRWPNLD